MTTPRRGGIDVFDSLLVRWPIDDDATATVRAAVDEWAGDVTDGDASAVVAGATVVTLFLDAGQFGDGDALLAYLEVPDAGLWPTPARTLERQCPLFERLDDTLGSAAVYADGTAGCRLVTHATHPRRQVLYDDSVDGSFVAPVAGDSVPIPVVVVAVPLRPGLRSRLVGALVDAVNRIKQFDRVQAWARDQTDVIETERMYTESLLLAPDGDRLVLYYYMETEDMDRLYEAYEASSDWQVRLSDWVFRRAFEEPAAFLEPPLVSDAELLVHAVDPDRP